MIDTDVYKYYRGYSYAKCSDGSCIMGYSEETMVEYPTEKDMQNYIDRLCDDHCHFCNSAIDPRDEWGEICLSLNRENSAPVKIRLCESCFIKHSFSLVSNLRGDIKIGGLHK